MGGGAKSQWLETLCAPQWGPHEHRITKRNRASPAGSSLAHRSVVHLKGAKRVGIRIAVAIKTWRQQVANKTVLPWTCDWRSLHLESRTEMSLVDVRICSDEYCSTYLPPPLPLAQ